MRPVGTTPAVARKIVMTANTVPQIVQYFLYILFATVRCATVQILAVLTP